MAAGLGSGGSSWQQAWGQGDLHGSGPGVRGIFMAAVCALDLGCAKTCLLREDRCDLLVCVCVCVA